MSRITEHCNLIGDQDSCAMHEPTLTISTDPLPLCRVGLGTRLVQMRPIPQDEVLLDGQECM